jgi:hypothetical protein
MGDHKMQFFLLSFEQFNIFDSGLQAQLACQFIRL